MLTLAALAALLAFGVSASVGAGDAREALRVIGRDAGPQAVATADLYFTLGDMDAQVANVLLIGGEEGLSREREAALRTYERRRDAASAALLQAADLTGDDPAEQRTVRDVLSGLSRYERLAAEALVLDRRSGHRAGPPPAEVTELYRRATDLMRLELLPKAYNLTLESGALVRRTYEDRRRDVLVARAVSLVAGLLLAGALVALQVYLAARFRRLLNPALALALAGAAVLTAAASGLLGGQAEQLRRARDEGFDHVLALSRARAKGIGVQADQSRFLLDPARRDTYEQAYLDQSQSIVYVPADSLGDYHRAVAGADGSRLLGLVGERVRGRTGEPAVRDVLTGFQGFQRRDRELRHLVRSGRTREAVALRLGASGRAFDRYDGALVSLVTAHRNAFEGAVRTGEARMGPWPYALPVGAVLIGLLVLAGVRPRLAEYR
ncbi:hypothetical protein D5H75_05900 [Bailinhaonella thermotolerans]|uniref:Secreted protein n=1 Tax=Bailinhaonella thermotolerans TaxID=1070861 RepID=A0A3A4AZM8_9ACTN|nr:hypothetical protein D5H75_05900 [Bailinhaonella thermotolerans]